MKKIAIVAVLITLNAGAASAGGLIGDLVGKIHPETGSKLDEAHRRFKEAVPPYKAVEETTSGAVRHVGKEVRGEIGGPALAEWIRASRRDAINAGVRPIPPQMYQAMRGYFPEEILSAVRYRTGLGNDLGLPSLSFRYGDAEAITLDDVIMFRSEDDAQFNMGLWAHELTHVQQFKRWGVNDFANRYSKNHGGIEDEAEDNSSRFLVWYDTRTLQKQREFSSHFPQFERQPGPTQVSPFGRQPQNEGYPAQSNICRTPGGACALPMSGPIGVSCWCNTFYGPIYGSLMR